MTRQTEDLWKAPPLSHAEVLALPAVADFVLAARAFALNRTQAYDLARRDRFPVPLLKFGHQRKARRQDILRALGIEERRTEGEVKAG